MNHTHKLKIILKELGMSGSELADLLGIKYASYRTMTGKSAKVVPKWVTAFVLSWEMARDPDLSCSDCKVRDNGYGKDLSQCLECASKPKSLQNNKKVN